MDSQAIAKALREAYINRTPIAPIREIIGVEDLTLAYEIQDINTAFRELNGAKIVGKKIGLTSTTVQKQFGITQPDFGILFDDMEVLNGQSINTAELMQPKAEAEIAFVLGSDLDECNLTTLDIIEAIDYCLPAIEIVGSRIQNWDIKITDTVADNASASHYTLGHRPRTLDEFDVVNCEMQMMKNGHVVSSGNGAACLGSPLNAVLWLANKMKEMGQPLKAGDLIFSGALGPMVNILAGDQIVIEIEGLGGAAVSFD